MHDLGELRSSIAAELKRNVCDSTAVDALQDGTHTDSLDKRIPPPWVVEDRSSYKVRSR